MHIDEMTAMIRARRDVALVVNARARHGARFFVQAQRLLMKRGYLVSAAYRVHEPRLLVEATRDAVKQGAVLVIVGGGDGTITTVMHEFAYRDLALGILPLGTGNSFAHSLGIPLSLSGALDVIEHGTLAAVDLGCADGVYFANVADMGISAAVARLTPTWLKRVFGVYAYVLVGSIVLLRHHGFSCEFPEAGARQWRQAHEIIIANSPFFGGAVLADAATLNRRLVISVMTAATRWELLRLWTPMLLGRPPLAQMHQFTTSETRVVTDPPQPLELDGEFDLQSPVRLTVAPRALRVMVPAA